MNYESYESLDHKEKVLGVMIVATFILIVVVVILNILLLKKEYEKSIKQQNKTEISCVYHGNLQS